MGNTPEPTFPAKAAMGNPPDPPFPSKSYELSGKIMLTAIIVLVSVMIFMVFLHIYARWYLLRVRRRHSRRRSRRRSHLVFYVGPDTPHSSSPASTARRGLDAAVLGSLPVFLYSDKTHGSLECAVCLSEFEENEKVRLLPKCNHCFHIECIDMWFHSHSTCPLCRSPVELPPANPSDFVSVSQLGHSEPGSSSGFCATCQHEGDLPYPPVGPSSLGVRRKGFEMGRVMIEVPRRTEFENELETSSPAGRLLSLKRLLSMNRRAAPWAEIGTSRGYPVAELDIESGKDELTQQSTRTPTPR